jgi:hypothetical protein
MSDTYNTDSSVVGNSESVSEGLTGEVSTPSETVFENSEDFVAESASVESIFELDGNPITLDEARNGYLRQADYTRKTQELSEMRTRLAEAEAITTALQNDPEGTLAALQDAFGIHNGYQENPFEGLDPDEARIVVLEQKIAAQESAANQIAIDREITALHEQFGDFDNSVLFAHAIKGGFQNLRAAYADMNFSSLTEQLQQVTAKQREEEQRLDAKREAANSVHNGSSRAGATSPAEPEKYGSLREAYLAAKKSLGV